MPSQPAKSAAPDQPRPVSNACPSLWPLARSIPPEPPGRPGSSGSASAGRTSEPRTRLRGLLASCLLSLVAATPRPVAEQPNPDLQRSVAAPSGKQTAEGRPIAWVDDEVTITLDPSVLALGPGSAEAVRLGFSAWSSTSSRLPNLRFKVADAPAKAQRDGVNRIVVADIDLPGHQKDLALTMTYSYDATGEISEVDIVLNRAYRFASGMPSSGEGGVIPPPVGAGHEGPSGGCGVYDLQNLVAHEAGHFFGLGEELSDVTATMFYTSQPCETLKRTVESLDASAMLDHYERAAAAQEPGVSCAMPAGSPPSGRTALATLLSMVLWTAWRRRWR